MKRRSPQRDESFSSWFTRIQAAVIGSLAFALLPAPLLGASLTWKVKLEPEVSTKPLVITVDTTRMNKDTYLGKGICYVRFVDRDGRRLGEKMFTFPVPQEAGKTIDQSFSHGYENVSSVEGIKMQYRIGRYGEFAVKEWVVEEGEIPAEQSSP
jgi:hypothetical protein